MFSVSGDSVGGHPHCRNHLVSRFNFPFRGNSPTTVSIASVWLSVISDGFSMVVQYDNILYCYNRIDQNQVHTFLKVRLINLRRFDRNIWKKNKQMNYRNNK